MLQIATEPFLAIDKAPKINRELYHGKYWE